MSAERDLVEAALEAATLTDAVALQGRLRVAVGGDFYRPLGDTWNNHGLMGSSGSYDLKLIEPVTNMQDSIIELLAKQRFTGEVPYANPHAAAADLLSNWTEAQKAEAAVVTFRESDAPATKSKRLTAVFRDAGCGLTPDMVPRTIFRLGGSHKEDALYLQGAFGLGGAMTYRNAGAVVLVSRRHPSLLPPGAEDRIVVAVVEWRENTKGQTGMYLVDQPWSAPGDEAEPWSCLSSEVPNFAPGTHLALISYRVDGFQRQHEGDEKSFNTVTDTRLFSPLMPITFVNETARGRRTVLRGLGRRLTASGDRFGSGQETLPFRHGGVTYHLPISYTLFEKTRQAGGRDKFVARDHAVIFTSNGQVHRHWTPIDFRSRTGLNKIYDRILVVVETDQLPIRLRTSLFTADRNDFVKGDAALRLEEDVTGFIKGWDALRDENNALIREALKAGSSQSTADLARRIGAALQVPGFGDSGPGSQGGRGNSGGRSGGGGGGTTKPIDLHSDPTMVKGPVTAQAELGATRALSFVVDAIDTFFEGRGSLAVEIDHPDISAQDLTVGQGRNGRVRVMLAIPETATLGVYELTASLKGWLRSSGGVGPDLSWTTKLEIVDEIRGSGAGSGSRETGAKGTQGASAGTSVALRWTNHEAMEDWDRVTVGEVESIPASILAETADYASLASLGDLEIPTISLNEEYPVYKRYIEARSRELTSLERPREQYAFGVGMALMLLAQDVNRRKAKNLPLPDDAFVAEAQRAAARAVLSVMPAFDDLAREAGLDQAATAS